MKQLTSKQLTILVTLVISLQVLLFFYWVFNDPSSNFAEHVPGMDKTDSLEVENTEVVVIGKHFKRFGKQSSSLTGKWTKFRGANHDNILKTKHKLNTDWAAKPLEILWQVKTGEGHAAPVIYNGLAYFLDYDETQRADMLRCFSLETGEERWRRWYKVYMKRNHGMSRTIPAITDRYIVTMGPRCHIMCVERETGDFLWGLDLEKEYGTETPFWYTGQCPTIHNNQVIVGVGGSVLMIGLNLKTGKIEWETPNPNEWKMSHSSVLPTTIAGTQMYIYAPVGGICGVSAEAKDRGKILWETRDWSPSVIAPSPIVYNQNKVYMTGGYGAGATVLQINKSGNGFAAETLEKYAPKDGLASEQQTPILHNGTFYGVLPKDAGRIRNQFVAYSATDLKTPLWQSGKEHRYGLGPYMLLNDYFLILNDEGTLTLTDANANKFKILSQQKLFDGHDAWGPFAYADGYLMLRDSKNVYCLRLSEK